MISDLISDHECSTLARTYRALSWLNIYQWSSRPLNYLSKYPGSISSVIHHSFFSDQAGIRLEIINNLAAATPLTRWLSNCLANAVSLWHIYSKASAYNTGPQERVTFWIVVLVGRLSPRYNFWPGPVLFQGGATHLSSGQIKNPSFDCWLQYQDWL